MLRAFVHGLELFIAGLGPDEQIVWTDTLFQGNANGIAEFNDRVTEGKFDCGEVNGTRLRKKHRHQ